MLYDTTQSRSVAGGIRLYSETLNRCIILTPSAEFSNERHRIQLGGTNSIAHISTSALWTKCQVQQVVSALSSHILHKPHQQLQNQIRAHPQQCLQITSSKAGLASTKILLRAKWFGRVTSPSLSKRLTSTSRSPIVVSAAQTSTLCDLVGAQAATQSASAMKSSVMADTVSRAGCRSKSMRSSC